jgi:hypothetical protein
LVLEFKVSWFRKTDGESAIVEGEQRMRLKLDGFVYNPKIGAKVGAFQVFQQEILEL